MSQALKFKNKLAFSLALSFLASSAGAVTAPVGAAGPSAPASPTGAPVAKAAPVADAERPGISYPAPSAMLVANTKPTPETAAVIVGTDKKEPPHKVVVHKASKKKHTAKAELKVAEVEPMKFRAPLPGEVEVSDRDYNHFIFPSAITQLVFPPNSAIIGKPVYLNNNTQALIEVQRGADKPIQMIVETEAGRVTKLYLKPRPINGITYRVDGARETAATPQSQGAKAGAAGGPAAPHAEDIELLKRAVQGDVPSEFEVVALPRPTRFDRFTVVPLAGWSNGSRRIMHFSLVAVPGKTAVVSDPQFYRSGITAVLLTGDHVDEESAPQLYVVEEVASDE